MSEPLDFWKAEMAKLGRPKILWCGAKKWLGSKQYDARLNAPHGEWVGSDMEGGEGVDVVINLQNILHAEDYINEFDAIYCPSVLEHVELPWNVFISFGMMLRSGGLLYVSTHQTFPLHYYPDDYWRFTTSSLLVLAQQMGEMEVLQNAYLRPCKIIPPESARSNWNDAAPAFLDVAMVARRR